MVSQGFWRIFPGQVIYLNDLQEKNYLLYAVTSDSRVTWNGPYALPLNGRMYPAMMIQLNPDRGGDWRTILYC
ncbi:MAG: DUF1036 domain-containing protein, partial [Bdellovibrionales bacterium]|nr:DUF1036 domain-containing protein [Bdellovibrionales bacterium]